MAKSFALAAKLGFSIDDLIVSGKEEMGHASQSSSSSSSSFTSSASSSCNLMTDYLKLMMVPRDQQKLFGPDLRKKDIPEDM